MLKLTRSTGTKSAGGPGRSGRSADSSLPRRGTAASSWQAAICERMDDTGMSIATGCDEEPIDVSPFKTVFCNRSLRHRCCRPSASITGAATTQRGTMRVYIMTDLEGAAGVANYPDWCMRTSPHYARACRYLTEEVNASIAGFRESGATAITVVDGHGQGGIDRTILDHDVEFLRVRGPNPYPFGLDRGYDVMAWVGQHAKAGTPYGHLPHTYSFNVWTTGSMGNRSGSSRRSRCPGPFTMSYPSLVAVMLPSSAKLRRSYPVLSGCL